MEIDWPSPVTAQAVAESGWTPQRRIDIAEWLEELRAEGYYMSPAATGILESFGKLALRPADTTDALWGADPYFFDPIEVGAGMYERYAELEEQVGHRMSPLAANASGTGFLLILDDGRVVADDAQGLWLLGDTFPEAIDVALRRHRTPNVLAAVR
ncbi:SUKH-3 domain-containing protein [Nocardia sp. NPDC003693]